MIRHTFGEVASFEKKEVPARTIVARGGCGAIRSLSRRLVNEHTVKSGASAVMVSWHRMSALSNLTPIAYAARNASGPQQAGALRSTKGFAPQPVATPDLKGPNDERILLSTG